MPLTPDYTALVVGFSSAGVEEVVTLARGARVVKAFDTAYKLLRRRQNRG